MERLRTPPKPDPIDRLIDGALKEASELSWDVAPAAASNAGDACTPTIARPPSPPHDAFPGYQVLKQLRAGGQAQVYLGVEETTGRRVAIKVFRPFAALTPRDRYRFEREVEALQELCHPGIVRILRADASPEHPFIVMEFVPGWNLDDYFREHDLDVRATMRMFRAIALAVHAAHQKGVIHRDVKPSNIRIDHNAEPHVFDFGLAKISSSQAPEPTMTETETGQFLGTLSWASPEQAEGRVQDVDVRTDVYSLGAVLYHMLTGELPFEQGGSVRDVLNRIATVEPIPPSKHRREIDDDVETIVLKCLAKEPSRRYTSASELAEDVERWVEGRPILAKRDSLGYVVGKFVRRHWAGCALVGALAFASAIGIGWHQSELSKVAHSTMSYSLATEWLFSSPTDTSAERQRLIELIRVVDRLPAGLDDAEFIMRRSIAARCQSCGFAELAYIQGTAAMRAARRLHGPGSAPFAEAASTCAGYAQLAGNNIDALAIADAAVAAAKNLDAKSKHVLSGALDRRAQVCLALNDLAESEGMIREGVAVARERWGDATQAVADHQLAHALKGAADVMLAIVRSHRARGMECEPLLQDAVDLQRESLDRARRVCADNPAQLAHHVHALATQLREAGRLEEAEPLALEAVDLRRRWIPSKSGDAVYTYASIGSLGVLRMHQGDFEAAEELLLEAYEGLTTWTTPTSAQLRSEFAQRLAETYAMWARKEPGRGYQEAGNSWRARVAEVNDSQ